jgi:hypothetical protein
MKSLAVLVDEDDAVRRALARAFSGYWFAG